MLENSKKFVNVENLWIGYKVSKLWSIGHQNIDVIKGVSFSISQGECYGLVGESGSGKSTILKSFIGLVKPYKGTIYIDGIDVYRDAKKGKEIIKRIGYVAQDPLTSVDPRMKVKDIVSEPLIALDIDKNTIYEKVATLLKLVGLDIDVMDRYPFELSGGMLQRITIARAIISKPKLVLLDEPTSALDTITQAQILKLLKDLKDMMNFTYIVVTHDLNVASYLSNRVGVLLKGYLIEEGDTRRIINEPLHPYTQIIVEASKLKDVSELKYSNVIGCPLYSICKYRIDLCSKEMPGFIRVDSSIVRCWYYKDK
jgi:ABC-type oligopeptide transport system ATPase subunit